MEVEHRIVVVSAATRRKEMDIVRFPNSCFWSRDSGIPNVASGYHAQPGRRDRN